MGMVRSIAERYWEAEETRNMASILAYYHQDAELVVPETGRLCGHHEIKTFYEASIRRFPILKVEILTGFEDTEQGAFEWRAAFADHEGRTVILTGVNIIATWKDKFKFVHVYYDPETLKNAASVGQAQGGQSIYGGQ